MASFRRLSARNIQRPQIKFKDKVDNSHHPFMPIIKEKPNALQPLKESLKLPENVTPEDTEMPDFAFPHPYQYELDDLQPLTEQTSLSEPQKAIPVADTPLTMVDTEKVLHKLVKKLKTKNEIAVDLEHHSYRTFQGITCLMQISTRTQDYIVDTLSLRSYLHLLNDVFTDPKIVKVFHGADNDIQWLQRDFGLYVVNMFDTGQAARVMKLGRFSLAYLLQQYCGVKADKQYQLADWRIRPLPQELVKYAREDTHYLLYIYHTMKNELLEQGNENNNLLMSVLQRSKQVANKVYKKPCFTSDDYMDLYRNAQQLMALQNLFAWRDEIARLKDESYGYVLPNHTLLYICVILPREKRGILACCNPIPPLVRQYLAEIHAIITKARKSPLHKMAHPLLFDATWLQQGKYESAEAYYQQVLTAGVGGASQKEETKTESECKATTKSQSKPPPSSLKSEIAEARQNIQNALKDETAGGQAVGDSEVMTRIQSLETENTNLKKASQDLQSLVKKLEARVSALEKGSSAPADTKPAAAAKATKDDDDDDFDMDFSDDEEEEDEEEAEEKKKRLEAYYAKKDKKPTVIAKSSLVLDVKPWSDETDMPELEKCVRSIAMEGLLWGASKFVAVGYGIRKLQISCVIVDDKVSTDALEEEITAFEDFVQSMDIAAFNKI